eukprot:jgi/Chlat1/7415/Chrsp6S07438
MRALSSKVDARSHQESMDCMRDEACKAQRALQASFVSSLAQQRKEGECVRADMNAAQATAHRDVASLRRDLHALSDRLQAEGNLAACAMRALGIRFDDMVRELNEKVSACEAEDKRLRKELSEVRALRGLFLSVVGRLPNHESESIRVVRPHVAKHACMCTYAHMRTA